MLKQLFFWIPVFFLLAACGSDDNPQPDPPVPPDVPYRTVLVYLGVDNNFRAEARMKIDTLWNHWQGDFYGNLLVYADSGGESVLVHIYQDTNKINRKDTVKTYPAENSADPAVLKRVLNEVKDGWPAQGYGLVVLSHATGWLPDGKLIAPSSLIDDHGRQMELRDFAEALPYKLEFILFDACLMASAEVAYELKEKTDYIVASPAEVITHNDQSVAPGFIYTGMMKHLMAPVADLKGVAQEFYDFYKDHPYGGAWRSATVSVIQTSCLDNLAELSRELLNNRNGEELTDINKLQTYGYGSHSLYTDIGDYIKALHPGRYSEYMKAVNDCMIYKAHTPGYFSSGNGNYNEIFHYSGLSVYIPQKKYPSMNTAYKNLKWTQRVAPYVPSKQ